MLVFPANVKASLKLLQLLDDPDFHLDTAAQIVITEPVIAARVVAIGNSAIFARRSSRVENVRTAVNLLGLNILRSLVAAIVVRQVCTAIASPALRAKTELLWQHSAHVAALAFVLARHVARVDPDTAMFAGIVHEIDGFYRLYRADGGAELAGEYPLPSSADADRALARNVLEALMVPKPVVSAVESLWGDGHNIPPATLEDTLSLANDLAAIPSPFDGTADGASVDSIDFDVRGSTLQTILAEYADEIRSLTEALLFY
jgi:hypothetical protein